ncbi:Glyoxylase, beta-lactamase superfamily II [Sporobacter termitidis DSM 10068]|uniref:Glyoxylase, beta-lactamase superfamily II n=1 Tax=Sporobacter termitidis DSM 10068 TaxID=1123282 RepID=A0A1M5Z918_9FIRM|nr:MBL fold metallo-hydrolase [Sporobacter termitidis]SHI20704.1 Glyoxylase, beta-lactamase superfamily II [Sporobacter termitidis DSM 10068]
MVRLGDRITGWLSKAIDRKYTLHALETGRITDKIYVFKTDTANFYVFRSGENFICFDTGYRPFLSREELKSLNIDPERVTHVFLTHADIDHVWGLRLFKRAAVYLSEDEEPLIRGIRPLKSAIRSPRLRRPYLLLRDNDVVTVGPTSVRAIATPGHTPGSMAYLVDGTYLFLGDTCKLKDGQAYAGKHYTMDYETQKESIRKLAGLKNVDYVFTAHSGYTQDFNAAFDYWKEAGKTGGAPGLF